MIVKTGAGALNTSAVIAMLVRDSYQSGGKVLFHQKELIIIDDDFADLIDEQTESLQTV